MLRIKLVISTQGEFVPTEYFLTDKYNAFTTNVRPKKRYYNVNNSSTNFVGGWSAFTMYCRRKMDLVDAVDQADTTINIRYCGEFHNVWGVDRITQHSKLYICQDRRYLASFSQQKPAIYHNGKKREFPSYLLVNNIDDLKKTVHFELTWSDNVSQQYL